MADPSIDADLVRELVGDQFPQWRHLEVRPVDRSGWDNRTFRLGDRLCVRLPSAACYAGQVERENRWLPRLAPGLPLPIPQPVALGQPACGYPWRWSVRRWLEGRDAASEPVAQGRSLAQDLARFLVRLRASDATGAPGPGQHNFWRGGPLETYDAQAREAADALRERLDVRRALAIWESGTRSRWSGAPVWFHGDVEPSNLLLSNGRLCAVIDFGLAGVGDPACDLVMAWTHFEAQDRLVFRGGLDLDAETWARGRAWALWKALVVAAAQPGTDPGQVGRAERTLGRILGEPLGDGTRGA